MGTAIPQFRARGHQPRTGPGPVAVAFLGRTSTATAQDPVESLAKQMRLARERLPDGFHITRYYWDVESGGIDLDARSRTGIWHQFAAAGIPCDGGMADLRAAIAAGQPPFTAAICENIERAGRDMYDALRLEKELGTAGIPIFATDEPIDADASHGSTLLVRRTKQGVAEYFRYNLKTQMWEGLRQYVIGGFNTGKTPYGYTADRSIHPNPMKASMGATRARLVPDPERGPWVTRIYQWRVWEKLSVPGIARRLTELGAPSPDGKAWSPSTVDTILRNPKYTGRVVLGRTTNTGPTARKGERKVRHLPREYWTWADEANAHPALVPVELWEAAQAIGRQRGNVRDPGTPGQPGGRRYPYRARLRCRQCKRRMHGITRPGRRPGQPQTYVYYVCPTQAANPRDAQDHPGHIRASVPEPVLTAALSDCLDKYALGHDRAAMLAQLIPATAAQQHEADHARADGLRRQLAQAQTAINALIAQVENSEPAPSPPTSPTATGSASNSATATTSRPPSKPNSRPSKTPSPSPTTSPSSTNCPTPPDCSLVPPTASAKPSPPPSTCKPPTAPTAGKPPSCSPSPTPPPASSPP